MSLRAHPKNLLCIPILRSPSHKFMPTPWQDQGLEAQTEKAVSPPVYTRQCGRSSHSDTPSRTISEQSAPLNLTIMWQHTDRKGCWRCPRWQHGCWQGCLSGCSYPEHRATPARIGSGTWTQAHCSHLNSAVEVQNSMEKWRQRENVPIAQ